MRLGTRGDQCGDVDAQAEGRSRDKLTGGRRALDATSRLSPAATLVTTRSGTRTIGG
ncbi:MAG: hypothetical protein ABR540_12660 [Acidimicrobiales bacterium]